MANRKTTYNYHTILRLPLSKWLIILIKSEFGNDDKQDLIKDKIEKYLIEDIIVTSKGSEFYISFGKLKETPIKKRIRIQKRVAINKIKKSNKNGANEEYNAKQREWYKWRKRAKKAGIPSLKNRRPTPTERKEWQNLIIQAEI